MKIRVLALVVCVVLAVLWCGCSGASQDSFNQSTSAKEQKEMFNIKCNDIKSVFWQTSTFEEYNISIDEPNVSYEDDEGSLSKIFVMITEKDGSEDRMLLSFLDIYQEDEYQYFLTLKKYINFINENVVEISGGDQYTLLVNADSIGVSDISITNIENEIDIIYGDRDIRAAYTNRLKSMESLKDASETVALSGLVKFDGLPSDVVPYDITASYNGEQLTHKWYELENGNDKVFVTYIDDGTYKKSIDGVDDYAAIDEFLYYAYTSAFNPKNKLGASNYFCFAYKSGEILGTIYLLNYTFYRSANSIWSGEYEFLNSHPVNLSYLNQIDEQLSD